MKKFKLSVIEKQSLRSIFIIITIQILIIQVFVTGYKNSFPVEIQDTKCVDITVSDVIKVYGRHRTLAVNVYTYLDGSDYTKFVFPRSVLPDEYSCDELYDALFPGESLSLRYVERRSIIGWKNIVVEARTATDVYRTLDGYNNSDDKESRIIMIVLLSIIEVVFLIGSVLYLCFEFKTIKSLIRKIKRYFKKRFAKNNKKA